MSHTSPSSLRLVGNLLSSYAYVGLMALVTLFVVPVYVRALGVSDWGSVALCVTVQGFLFSLDVALGPLMLRDVARATAAGLAESAYSRFLRFYAIPAVCIFSVGQLVLFLVARLRWSQGIPMSPDLLWAMRIALVQFLFQFSNNAAIGYWNGQEKQRLANTRLAGFAVAKHGLALLLLTKWQATAVTYMIPFAAISIIEFALNYRRIRFDHHTLPNHPNLASGTSNWRDVAGFGGAAALGLMTAQVDRVFLSVALPAERYGIYFLITSLMFSLLSLQVPIQRAFQPRMATAANPRHVAASMLKVSLTVVALPCAAMALFPQFVLGAWLHNPDIAATAALPFRMLMIAVSLNAIFASADALLLHHHRNRTLAAINSTILAVQLLILAILTPIWGMVAGSTAWLACGVIHAICAGIVWKGANHGD